MADARIAASKTDVPDDQALTPEEGLRLSPFLNALSHLHAHEPLSYNVQKEQTLTVVQPKAKLTATSMSRTFLLARLPVLYYEAFKITLNE